jgi:Membrane bound FAD containing D-sorbitol dehydrogenase
MASDFLGLSRVLTGEQRLDEGLASQYFDRLHAVYPPELDQLVAAFATISGEQLGVAARLKELLDAEPALAKMAKQVIVVWFTSQFMRPDGRPDAGTAEQWKSGLLWRVIHAPVPAAVAGRYGYWADRPVERLGEREG